MNFDSVTFANAIKFKGTLDGAGHTLSNIKISKIYASATGTKLKASLFDDLCEKVTFRNIKFDVKIQVITDALQSAFEFLYISPLVASGDVEL